MDLKKFIAQDPEELVSIACAMMVADGGRQGLRKYIIYTEQMAMEANEWLDTLESIKRKNASKASPQSGTSSSGESSKVKSSVAQATTPAQASTTS